MTTGSKISDRTTAINIEHSSGYVYGTSRVGSYSSRVWSGSDQASRPKKVYDKQFYYVPVPIPGTPDKVRRVVRYVKVVILKRILVTRAHFVYGPKIKGQGRKKIFVPAVYAVQPRTARHRKVTYVRVPGKPAGVKYLLRYRKVANPTPRTSWDEHPYNVVIKNWSDSAGTISQRIHPRPSTNTDRESTTVTNRWFYSEAPSLFDTWDSNDDIRALGKLREKVAGSDFNFAVFLAEGNQSMEMIFNAAHRIDKAYNRLKRGNLAGAWNALSSGSMPRGVSKSKTLGNNWLEMQYGWLPLLSDAEAGAQFLAHLSSGGSPQVVRARTKKILKVSSALDGSGAYTAVGFEGVTLWSCKAILKDVSVIGLSGLLDPLSVAWEKLPFSFVADWFIPIGAFLSARGLAASLQGTYVITKTTRLKWGGVRQTKSPDPNDPYEFRYEPGPYSWSSVEVDRTVSNSLNVPMPNVKRLSDAFSWRRAANAVGLLLQRHG